MRAGGALDERARPGGGREPAQSDRRRWRRSDRVDASPLHCLGYGRRDVVSPRGGGRGDRGASLSHPGPGLRGVDAAALLQRHHRRAGRLLRPELPGADAHRGVHPELSRGPALRRVAPLPEPGARGLRGVHAADGRRVGDGVRCCRCLPPVQGFERPLLRNRASKASPCERRFRAFTGPWIIDFSSGTTASSSASALPTSSASPLRPPSPQPQRERPTPPRSLTSTKSFKAT